MVRPAVRPATSSERVIEVDRAPALGAGSLGDRELAALGSGRLFLWRMINGTGPGTARRTWDGSARWLCACSRRRRTARARVSRCSLSGCGLAELLSLSWMYWPKSPRNQLYWPKTPRNLVRKPWGDGDHGEGEAPAEQSKSPPVSTFVSSGGKVTVESDS